MQDPPRTFKQYPKSDESLAARYARAIAHYRTPNLDAALEELDALIEQHPDDPYMHELRGQILFENGYIADAIDAYEEAVKRLPDAALPRLELAMAQLASEDTA